MQFEPFHPGETIAQTFIVPYRKDDMEKIIISYRQCDYIILEKIITSTGMLEIENDETAVSSIISEAESLLFKELTRYGVELNVFFKNNSGRAVSYEIYGETLRQHIRQLGRS